MSHRRDNSIYLTYHEATLYCSDIEYFRAGAWLNDHIILFAYEYFHYSSKYKDIMETVCLCHPHEYDAFTIWRHGRLSKYCQ